MRLLLPLHKLFFSEESTERLVHSGGLRRKKIKTQVMSQRLLKNTFAIAEDPWWRSPHCDPRGVDSLVDNIICLHKIIKNEVTPGDPYWEGFSDFHHKQYLMECITGECSNTTLTMKDVDKMMNPCPLKELLYYFFDTRKLHVLKKVQKLHQATRRMFPEIFLFEPPDMTNFDSGFVKEIHRLIGEGIIDDAGEFRTQSAKPAQENYIYLAPDLIEERLQLLLKECREVFGDPNLAIIDAVKYGACFLENFLYVHPFSNGNGRVGRLLLSYLLTNHTVVPLSLYSTGKTRDVYLQCLRECRRYHAEFRKPASFARFILENIEREFRVVCVALDIRQSF